MEYLNGQVDKQTKNFCILITCLKNKGLFICHVEMSFEGIFEACIRITKLLRVIPGNETIMYSPYVFLLHAHHQICTDGHYNLTEVYQIVA